MELTAKRSGETVHLPAGVWLKATIIGVEDADDIERLFDPDLPLIRIISKIDLPTGKTVDFSEIATKKLTTKSKLGDRVRELSGVEIDWSGKTSYVNEELLVGKRCVIISEDKRGEDGEPRSRIKQVISESKLAQLMLKPGDRIQTDEARKDPEADIQF